MNETPAAVTFDFHNTLAVCDQWFELEVRQVVPAFLNWHAACNGSKRLPVADGDAIDSYRRLRLEIMDHGMEVDAVSCVDYVTRELGYPIELGTIEHGVQEIMQRTLADSVPVPGVVESVRRLQSQGIRLGVVSSAAYHPFLQWSLEKFGILDAFDSIVTSASCGYYKTRTEIYSAALADLKTSADRTVHIGDSLRFDVETAARLGIKTIWFNRDADSSKSSVADAVVTSLEDVDAIAVALLRNETA